MNEKTVVVRPMKSPALAGILSAFLPFGVGAFYNEQRNKALVQLVVAFGLIWALARGGNGVVFGLAYAAFYFYQLIDNIQSARAINAAALGQPAAAEAVAAPQEPEAQGSVFWGSMLIALGIILILANFEVIPYRILGNYWPVPVILIGVKLVLDAAAKPKKDE